MLALNLYFYFVSLLILIASLTVILARNPITSILALVFTFVNVSIIFVMLHAEFIAMVMLIIYVGAIAVLFIFIVMLLNIKYAVKRRLVTKNVVFGVVLGLILLTEIIFLFKGSFYQLPNTKNMGFHQDSNNSYNLALELYNNHYSLIIILGVILTFVVIGIINVCYEGVGGYVYTQKMGSQTKRNPKLSVKAIQVENEKGIE